MVTYVWHVPSQKVPCYSYGYISLYTLSSIEEGGRFFCFLGGVVVVVVVGYIEKRATDKCLCVRRVLERAPATRISKKNPTAESFIL